MTLGSLSHIKRDWCLNSKIKSLSLLLTADLPPPAPGRVMTCFLPQLLSAPSHPVPGYFLSSAAHTPCTLCWHNRVQHLKWTKTLAIVPKPLRLRVRSSAQMDKGSSLHLALEFSEHSSVLSCCPKHITGAQQVYAEECPTRSRASMPDVKGMCPLLMTSTT